MKILIVHNFYQQPGGEDAVVRDQQALLVEHGVEVAVHAVDNHTINTPWDRLHAAMTVTYNSRARDRLRARLEAERPDVMHVHNFFPLLSPSIFDAARDAGVASVFTLHNFRILCPTAFLYHEDNVRERSLHHPCWWTVRRRVYRGSMLGTLAVAHMVETHKRAGTWNSKVDRFIALTPYAKRKFIEGGLPADRIAVKAHSVADRPGRASEPIRRGALYVGRLSPEKGIDLLLHAWRNLDYPLRVVGDGPLANEVRAAGGNVTAVGHLSMDAVRREMEVAAFLIVPSVWNEMFGMVIIEAMAAGLPVIVSRLEGLMSIVEENVTGLSFNVADVRSLRDAVRWATKHPDAMAAMGRAGRENYLARHTPRHDYHQLMDIYGEAIAHAAERKA
jgi:glycosyltransferase involved in cell wall biosynthesis